jgi:hypothetical protein
MRPSSRSFEVVLPSGRRAIASQRALPDRWDRRSHTCIELEERSTACSESTLESMGRLAGELAHDINNQLSAALNYVFVLQRRLGRIPACGPHLDGLHAAAWQAASLASSLKLVARKRSQQPEWVQLDGVVSAMLPLLRHLVGDARVELRAELGLPQLYAPLAYVEQLIVMLTLSSIQRGAAESSVTLCTSSLRLGGDPAVRLSCELTTAHGRSAAGRAERAMGSSMHGGLRRAVKHCHGHLAHDATRIWVDLANAF